MRFLPPQGRFGLGDLPDRFEQGFETAPWTKTYAVAVWQPFVQRLPSALNRFTMRKGGGLDSRAFARGAAATGSSALPHCTAEALHVSHDFAAVRCKNPLL